MYAKVFQAVSSLQVSGTDSLYASHIPPCAAKTACTNHFVILDLIAIIILHEKYLS
jgi:hypothetical protein